MSSTGFGRRIVESTSRDIVTTPAPEEPAQAAPTAVPAAKPESLTQARTSMRELIMQRINPAAAMKLDREDFRKEILRLVAEIGAEQRLQLNIREQDMLVQELIDDMIGLGPLEPLLNDDAITDIMVNGPHNVFVEKHGKLEQVPQIRFRDNQHVNNVAQRIAAGVGRRVDEASPMADARLQDGSRVNILLPPLALNGPTISIRKFSRRQITLEMMARQGNMSPPMARFLELAARARLNILISGGTGSGKTTLLNAIARNIEPSERIITIEDAAELQIQLPHVVSIETRPPNLEGQGEITQRDLLKNALRMRPDRIIVGEVRGGEAFDMLQAMNTGHDGSMSTVHANTPRDGLARIENMALLAAVGLPARVIRTQIVSAIDLVVQIERMRDGVRRIQSCIEVIGLEGDTVTTQDLFTFQYEGENRDGSLRGSYTNHGYRPHFLPKIAPSGLERRFMEIIEVVER
ncbi:MAG TPA: CpaF family protein [Stellaceae bacterium]|jgi:pilus assembly protein CpaF|nr:CpaF family protein [Stellaceae bacterium]